MIALILATLSSPLVAHARRPPDAAAVKQRIDSIVAALRFPEDDGELWGSASLREMYLHSALFLPGIEGYLRANPKAPELNVRVALRALQCLQLDQYLDFTARLAQAHKGAVGKWALFYALVPGAEWSMRLGVAYKDERVRSVLKQVSASSNADEQVRSAVTELLRGDISRYARTGREHAVLECGSQ